jgi:hypothetical protein
MSIKGKSLHLLTPMYGGVNTVNYFDAFQKLVIAVQKYGIPFWYSNIWNESLVTRARNKLADTYLKEGEATHAVYIDADIGFDADELLSMLEREDEDIIVAPCSKKSVRWDRVQRMIRKNPGREYTGEELRRAGGDLVFNFEAFEGERTWDLQKMWDLRNGGTGIMMIRRGVFEKFKQEYPDRWYEPRSDDTVLPGPIHDFFRAGINPDTREYDSEDYCFCIDCKRIGFSVRLCPWVRTTHMGSNLFYGDLPAVSKLAGEL